MKTSQKGSLQLVLLIIIVLAIGLAGGYFLSNKDKVVEDTSLLPQSISTPTNTTDVTPVLSYPAKPVVTAPTPVAPAPTPMTSAPAVYKQYTNQTIGFSTLISNKGKVGDAKTNTLNWSFYEGENPQFVYVYGPDPKTNIKTWIVVWQEERGTCLSKLVNDEPNFIEPRQNKANLTIMRRNWNDAATGQYEDLNIYSISNSKKKYCVVGQIHGSRPYDLEDKAYEDQEKVNTAAVAEFMKVLNVFVDNFKFI